ncbi:MAG: diguanylate cyclase [Spirochaetaceae bacterium]|jgi:diguanylate cyclase (GGDEF)-like protein|nr:diguanylate cyclase [Spirochaetaceae bacterium]
MSGFNYTVTLVVYTISFGVLSADLVITVFRHKVKHVRFFNLLMLASGTYALGFLLQHLSTDYAGLLQGARVQYLGAVFVSPMLLLFIIDFCGIKQRAWLIVSTLIIPAVTLILVFTYPFNGIYFGESSFTAEPVPLLVFRGSVFRTVYFVYSYAVMLAAFLICSIRRSKRDTLFRKHSLYILAAMAIPLLGNLLTAFLKLFPVDLTSVFASIMGTIIAYTLLFTEAFQLAPLAREEIVENMKDGFILIDQKNRFVDANRTAKRLFPALEQATVGLPAADIAMTLWEADGRLTEEFSVKAESATKHYRVSADTVIYEGHAICTCVTIYDNTSVRELIDEITRMAEHDALTNLLNRRSFCRDAERKCDELLRYGGKAFFMMFDVDFFKKINDTYGHLAGDNVLRAVSGTLLQCFRKTDMVGRYGGEEFCAFLFMLDEEKAAEIAEECRRHIEALTISFEDKTIRVTISIGMAEFPSAGEQTLTELISRADAALYEAKLGGRNRVVSAQARCGSGRVNIANS